MPIRRIQKFGKREKLTDGWEIKRMSLAITKPGGWGTMVNVRQNDRNGLLVLNTSLYRPFTTIITKLVLKNGMSITNEAGSCLVSGVVRRNETMSILEVFTFFTQSDSSLRRSRLCDALNAASGPRKLKNDNFFRFRIE